MKKISWVLIVALCLEILSPGILSMQQSVQALEGQQQGELLTIDSLAAKYQVSPTSIIEMLNAGYNLMDIATALDKNEDVSKLFETLNMLFPGKGKPYEPPTVTDATYWSQLLSSVALKSVGEVTYEPESVTGSVYARLSLNSSSASQYDELTLKNQHVKLDQAPYSVSTGVENISTQDGSLNLTVTDIGIPGRNGLSFQLTRLYNSNDAEYYNKGSVPSYVTTYFYTPVVIAKIYKQNRVTNQYEYHTQMEIRSHLFEYKDYWRDMPTYTIEDLKGRTDNRDAFKRDHLSDPNKALQEFTFNSGDDIIRAYLYPTGELSPKHPYAYEGYPGTKQDNKVFKDLSDRQTRLGTGWSWDIPQVQMIGGYKYVRLPGGGTYLASNSEAKLVDYPWDDILFYNDFSRLVEGVPSEFVLKYKNGTSYYFTREGNLLQITDTHGNYINFKYEKPYNEEQYVLKQVSDPLGNKLTFTYEYQKITVTNGTDTVAYQTMLIPGSSSSEAGSVFTLSSVKDVSGKTTYYTYKFAESKFSIIYNVEPNERNDFALISSIHHPTGAKTVFSYDSFMRRSGYYTKQLNYRIVERKEIQEYVDGRVTESNNRTFRYELDPYYYKGDYQYQTIMSSGDLTTIYIYNKIMDKDNPKFFHLETIVRAGNTEHVTIKGYDANIHRPYPTQIITKNRSGSAEGPALVTNRQYDIYGNITSETNNMGGSTITTYDPTFALPQTITTKVDANQQSVTRFVRNSQGSVVESKTYANAEGGPLLRHTNFEYDGFGNVTKVIANNNG
ncbi:hypothetical protein, partial [Paenibacillus taiwanensis]|uniref:hypothetical protein n=1 Tax=Paenibacillus taiwanensis TaxID=401638 RepID=UPI00048E8AF3